MNEKEMSLAESVRTRTIQYITAAFGLIAGLAWNDAVRSLIELTFPKASNTVTAKFIYALILTALLVLVTISLARALGKFERKQ